MQDIKESVTLQQILDFRELKVQCINDLLNKYNPCSIITLGMNIPGGQKTNKLIRCAFLEGKKQIQCALNSMSVKILLVKDIMRTEGLISFFVVDDKDSKQLKIKMIDVEDKNPKGRLFDIDVYNANGEQLSRECLNLPCRKCFICEKPAKECARNRTHSASELQKKIEELLKL